MKTKTLLSLGLLTSALAMSANAAGVWNVTYGVDPETGWATNGTVIEAVNLGPTSGTNALPLSLPVTVNGINFITTPVLTTNWGAGPWAGTNNYYTGADPAAQNLYWSWQDINSWSSPNSASYKFANLTPGHVYQVQFMMASGWDWAGLNLWATGDGGATWANQWFQASSGGTVDAATWTWKADATYGQVDMYLSGWSQGRVFGYSLRDLSAGPPVIYGEPVLAPANTVYAGTTVSMSVASYGALPLAYQWRTNTVPIPWATNASLVLSNTIVGDSASYDVVVTNLHGAATSVANYLTVNPANPPVITSDPLSADRLQHSRYVFVASVDGTPPFKMQWKLNDVDVPGATNATLSLTNIPLTAAGTYVLMVTNQFGDTSTTPVTLGVTPGLALNPLFGNGGGSVATASFDNWGYDGWSVSSAALDGTYGTCALVVGNWNTIYQDTGAKFAPNTVYTLTAALTGPSAAYMSIEDASSSTNQSAWTQLVTAYCWLGGGAYSDRSITVDTSLRPGVVGHNVGIRFRESSAGSQTVRVANVRLDATGPGVPTLSHPTALGGGKFRFTVNSWTNQVYDVLVSHDLTAGVWTPVATITNASGADVFTDTSATNAAAFYRLQTQ